MDRVREAARLENPRWSLAHPRRRTAGPRLDHDRAPHRNPYEIARLHAFVLLSRRDVWLILASIASPPKPILFEAALPQRTAFTLDGEGEATLKLVVSEQFAKVLSDNIHRLRNCSFVVRIDGFDKAPSEY